MYWVKVSEGLRDIAVGTPSIIWGITPDDKILKHVINDSSNGAWIDIKPLPNGAIAQQVECASDGTVICRGQVGAHSMLFRYNHYTQDWISIQNGYCLDLTLGSNGSIYVIGLDRNVYYYAGENTFIHINKTGIYNQISIGSDGTFCGLGSGYHLWRMDDKLPNIQQPMSHGYTFTTLSVASASKIMAITSENQIVTYIGESNFHIETKMAKYFEADSGRSGFAEITGRIMTMDHDIDTNCFINVVDEVTETYSTYQRIDLPMG